MKLTRKREEEAWKDEMDKRKREFQAEFDEKWVEVKEREAKVKEMEMEYENVRKELDELKQESQKLITDAVEKTKQDLNREFSYERALTQKTFDGEKKLLELRVKKLEEQVKGLVENNNKLKEDSKAAIQKVQDIALKTIESRSGVQAMQEIKKIALEQAKVTKDE